MRVRCAIWVCLVVAAWSIPAAAQHAATARGVKSVKTRTVARAAASLTEEQRALHALNRLTFGPRPGDLQQVMAMGVDDWVERQLHPNEIDNKVLDGKLGPLRTLRMSAKDVVQNFPTDNLVRQVSDGKVPIPTDPMRRAVYEVLVDAVQEQQRQYQLVKDGKAPDDATKTAAEKNRQDAGAKSADSLLALPKEKRWAALVAFSPTDRRILATYAKPPQRDKLIAEFPADQREAFQAMANPGNPVAVPMYELQQSKLLRAVYSERQLEEVMTDFWFNHFNVFLGKDADRLLVTSYERDVIRPNAFGKFKDLLVATAQSPAMLYYLDNWLSIGPGSVSANPPGRKPNPSAAKAGLNENYGRELMELHTLSVTGGYTQKDVTEAARVLTGWTIQPLEQGAPFQFDPKKHDPGDKVVVGQTISENGINEGMQLLDMLAHHPNTAKFICTKMARRFVSDDPPATLVEKMTQKFLGTDGDIREVLRTMLKSPEFWSPKAYRAKVKTPLEFLASSIRATGSDLTDPMPLLGLLGRMGMPLYQMAPPTGYSTMESAWMNSDALLERFNFALQLTNGQVRGVNFDAGRLLALGTLTSRGLPRLTPESSLDSDQGSETALLLLENGLVNGEVSSQTQQTIRKQLDDPQVAAHLLDSPVQTLATMTALLLGSPEFQHR